MNILFVIKKEIHSAVEPLGLLYLSSVLKENNHRVFIEDISLNKVSRAIKKQEIKILGISCMDTDLEDYLNFCQKIKKRFPNILIIWGGPTPTYNPKIINQKPIDIICRGEGEDALLVLLNQLEQKKSILKIANLWIKHKGKIYKNSVSHLIANLDTIPFPDRNLIQKFIQFRYSPLKFVMTSRGCPFNCSFCFNHQFHQLYQGKGKIVRLRSVNNIIAEATELKIKYQTKFLYFLDDVFPTEKLWLKEFAQKYSQQVNIPFTIAISANLINEVVVKSLRKAGCKSIHLSIECGDEDIRQKILNKYISNQQIEKAIKLAHQNGMAVSAYNMIGIPKTTFAMDLKTLDFNLKTKVDATYVSYCLPFPNTTLGQLAKKAGLITTQTKFYSWFESTPLNIENKIKLEKFGYFFPLMVFWPTLRPFLFILLKIPAPIFLLKLIKDFINGYCLKTRMMPIKTSYREIFVTAYFFLFKRFTK